MDSKWRSNNAHRGDEKRLQAESDKIDLCGALHVRIISLYSEFYNLTDEWRPFSVNELKSIEVQKATSSNQNK